MDYRRIRGMDSGQRHTFEELICQIARRDPPEQGAEFRRIEGAGGDGGIEAYWLLSDGSKIGYQAKCYWKSGDIDWANITDSVERAIQAHPSLSKYVLAVPCDLTDRTGKQGSGKRGWQHWETHKAKWKQFVPPGYSLEFEIWTASDLTDRLAQPCAEGLKRYWFGDVEFSPSWFKNNIDLAIRSLDERYHADDHVEIRIERLFKLLSLDQDAISIIQSHTHEITKSAEQLDEISRFSTERSRLISATINQSIALKKVGERFTSDPFKSWPVREFQECLDGLLGYLDELNSETMRVNHNEDKTESLCSDLLEKIEERIGETLETTRPLRRFLEDRYFPEDEGRCVYLYGKAGTGKSHLLGNLAQNAVTEGRVAILLLGQQLNNSENIWSQIYKRLGLGDLNPDTFLQALSSAAEATRKRGLIFIDALNEASGLRLWRNELSEFIARIEKHQNLLFVFTCRTEYEPYIVPKKIRDQIPSYNIRGFETFEEQTRAARVYLGKRGISQPNSPWLTSEFVNPLFLRSACLALALENKTEFPKGLAGTKQVFSFYLKSVARNLGVGRDGSDDLVKPTNQALSGLAREMALNGCDYVYHSEAIRIVSDKFSAYPAPPGKSWFEVLEKNGLIRLDPNPNEEDESDAFASDEEIARFSFQRLQDHLMASGLLDRTTDPIHALDQGSLNFIHDGRRLHGKWLGLSQALSIQLPERFGLELLDALPSGLSAWANDYSTREAFFESLRWRSHESFTKRTLELYNSFLRIDPTQFDILLQVSASSGHPWNANFIHERLLARDMPKRDAFWTVRVNGLSMDEGETIRRLIEWSAFEQSEHTDPEVQHLCAKVLTWFFASSNREIRDKSTKALTALMISSPSLYGLLCEDFEAVDDLYILERLHSAAFGACCIDASKIRLQSYSEIAYRTVFDREDVPLSIILRDCAYGIIEMTLLRDFLPERIDILRAMPPYKSKPIRLSVTESALEKLAKTAGDSQILYSCTGWAGDFSSYEIEPRVGSFWNVPLRSPEPLTDSEKYERFRKEVIDQCDLRVDILNLMHDFSHNRFRDLLNRRTASENQEDAESFNRSENLLMQILNAKERKRYNREYKKRFNPSVTEREKFPYIDIHAAKRWVAKRAYTLGWTKELFPDDRSIRHDHSRNRPLVERIGKKYQWLALDELLCSFADNKWLSERNEHDSRRYSSPLDLGVHRDIDPTILLSDDSYGTPKNEPTIEKFEIVIPDVAEDLVGKWPFEADPSCSMASMLCRPDANGKKWMVLHEHRSVTKRYEKKDRVEHGFRQQEWRFLLPVFVRKDDEQKLLAYIRKKKDLDVDTWTARNRTDDGYLREAPWRSTWGQQQWTATDFHGLGEVDIAYPCSSYHWESHLDLSLPKGAHAMMPAPWLAHRLGLIPHTQDATIYVDSSGLTRFICGRSPGDGSYAFLDQELFQSVLDQDGLACLWIFVAERNAWPGGENEHASRRRMEGVVWDEEGKLQTVSWNDDWGRGGSKRYVPAGKKVK